MPDGSANSTTGVSIESTFFITHGKVVPGDEGTFIELVFLLNLYNAILNIFPPLRCDRGDGKASISSV